MKLSTRTWTALASLCLIAASSAIAQTAFPGAYGFGANATGGRGGTIYHVTNLNDSGAGSFRDAVSVGNRIIVFDVGGYIVLKSPVSLVSNLTIAGQTAPGGGIGIMAGEVSLSGKTNVIIRNVRMRQGNLDHDTGKSALNMGTSSNIMLDHCSFAYGQWDSVDAVKTANFTVQNSIIANPIGQQFGAHVEGGPSTFYRNLWVNAHNRQPLSKDNTQYINNVIYDYELGYTSGNTGGFNSHDLVNNYFITGPMTTTPQDDWFQMNSKQSVYVAGNFLDSVPDGILNGTPDNSVDASIYLTSPWSPTTLSIPTLSAADAYSSLVASAGAFPRDAVDNFALGDVTSLGLKGQLYKDQNLTGLSNKGYGTIASGTPFTNTSGDGIADYWATANGIGTTDPAAGNAAYGSTGYTNIEAYVNSLVLPAPWAAADMTGTPIQGASSYNTFTNQWLLTGSGGNPVSEGQFASQPWTSDGTIAAEVLNVAGAGSGAEGGLLLSSTGGAGTSFVALMATGSGGLSFVWQSAGGSAQSIQVAHTGFPLYLKIGSAAGSYAGYYSTDGTNYTLLGVVSNNFPAAIQAGLAFGSGSEAALGTALFTNVSVSPVANIWVADGNGSGTVRVEEFDGSGAYLSQFTINDGGRFPFGAVGMAIAPNGSFYIADSANKNVSEFSSTGAFIGTFGSYGSGNGQFLSPGGIAVDASGNAWIVDVGNNRVQEFSSGGAYLSQFGTTGSGNGQFFSPGAIVMDGAGNIWVADGNGSGTVRVEEFNSSGAYLSQFTINGGGRFPNGVAGMAIDPSGNFLITDIANKNVSMFSSAGTFIRSFGSYGSGNGQFVNGIDGIAVNAIGNAWVVDAGNYRVQEFSRSGAYLSQSGTVGSGNGQFFSPGTIGLH